MHNQKTRRHYLINHQVLEGGYQFRTGYGWSATIRCLNNERKNDQKLAEIIDVSTAILWMYYLMKISLQNEILSLVVKGRNVTAAEIVDLLENQQLKTVQIITVAAIFQDKYYFLGSQGFNTVLNAIEQNTTLNVATLITEREATF